MGEQLTLYSVCWYFVIYSFVGWCTEVIYQAVSKGKIVNRGFLNGPVCPIYGFGMIAVLLFFHISKLGQLAEASGFVTFLAGIILATAIELFGGWILDISFHTKWWDYSNEKFNLHGYICLKFSIIWGIGVVFIMDVIHPVVRRFSVNMIPEKIGWWILAILYIIYFVDLVITVAVITGLNKELKQLDEARSSMRVVSDRISTNLGEGALKTTQILEETQVQGELVKDALKEEFENKKAVYEATRNTVKNIITKRKRAVTRIMDAFPDLNMHEYQESINELKTILSEIKEKH